VLTSRDLALNPVPEFARHAGQIRPALAWHLDNSTLDTVRNKLAFARHDRWANLDHEDRHKLADAQSAVPTEASRHAPYSPCSQLASRCALQDNTKADRSHQEPPVAQRRRNPHRNLP